MSKRKRKDEYTVSKLCSEIESLVSAKWPSEIAVIGEVSNAHYAKRHLYFNLKDDKSSINIVYWNGIDVKIEDGMKLKVTGKIHIYPPKSQYDIIVSHVEELGKGKLFEEYKELEKYFKKKGYFSPEKKRKLSSHVNRIGVITSPKAAAIKDFLYALDGGRFNGQVFIYPCTVQGPNCPLSIVDGLKFFRHFKYQDRTVDTVVLTRGGGSFEDLMGFSHPTVIEALNAFKVTKICTISAVGHEVDTMLSDRIADIRVPTPSLAGEYLTKNKRRLQHQIGIYQDKFNLCQRSMFETLNNLRNSLGNIRSMASTPEEIFARRKIMLHDRKKDMKNQLKNTLQALRYKLENCQTNLEHKDPKTILVRGYAQVQLLYENHKKEYESIGQCFKAEDVTNEAKMKIIFHDGEVIGTFFKE
jgi:exodeoxyribonuclease VII large subunit